MSWLKDLLNRVRENRLRSRTSLIMPSALLKVILTQWCWIPRHLPLSHQLVAWCCWTVASVCCCCCTGECYHLCIYSSELTWTGKLSEVSGLNMVLVTVESCWYGYCLSVLLLSVLIRDLLELEEVSYWKSDQILPPGVLLACKQVERIACILQSVWAS
jgi:hypothetical protein